MPSDGPLLARAAYDRAAHHRSDDEWLATAWTQARVLVISPKSATPVADGPELAFRASADVPADAPRRFLGVAGDVPYFAVTTERDSLDDGGEWLTLRDVGPAIDDLQAGLLTSAIALEQWH
ncbi:MAG: diphosphatase, partial [Pseudonocardiales bacterium]|nr:diphosphatase [Pseudonocardiales bacterium]